MKQDERTPGPWRLDGSMAGPNGSFIEIIVRGEDGEHPTMFLESTCETEAEHRQLSANAEFIVKAVNAYTSTEALRSALAEAKAALNTIRNASLKGCEYGYGKPEQFADELYRSHGDVHRALVKIDAALSGSPAPSTSPMEIEMTEAQIKHMVDRFLAWKLPKTFSPDGGISFERIAGADGPHPFTNEPSGTNLLCATEATEMVRHMLEGLPGASPAPSTEGLREALMLAEKADRIHCKCQECEDGAQSAEACEHCFPSADDARVARRNVLKALGVKMRDVDRCAPDAARTALAGVTAPSEVTE